MDPKEAKILVGMPNYTNLMSSEVYANHLECNTQWEQWGLDVKFAIIGRTFVHFARTQICQVALEGDFTHILWLDDDAVIRPEILPRFIEHDVDVVLAPYPMRRPPHQIGVLKSVKEDFHDHASYRNFTTADLDQGLVEIDGGGTHCMLIKTAVLKHHGDAADMATRYPQAIIELMERLSDKDKDDIDHYVGNLPDETMSLEEEDNAGKPYFMMPKAGTEDMYFCYRLKKKGIKIWCDTDVFADHVGFVPIVTRSHTEAHERAQAKSITGSHSGIPLLSVREGAADVDGGGTTDDRPADDVSILRQPVVDRRRKSSVI